MDGAEDVVSEDRRKEKRPVGTGDARQPWRWFRLVKCARRDANGVASRSGEVAVAGMSSGSKLEKGRFLDSILTVGSYVVLEEACGSMDVTAKLGGSGYFLAVLTTSGFFQTSEQLDCSEITKCL